MKSTIVRTYRKITRPLFFFASIYLQRQTPIIIFQMGKVGSSSVAQSLVPYVNNRPVFHAHFLRPARLSHLIAYYEGEGQPPPFHLSLGLEIHRHIIERNLPTKFITMIRDPIARNISSAFQNFELTTGMRYGEQPLERDKLLEIIAPHGLDSYPLTWFDDEVKPVLGIDVYAQPFPHERGYAHYQNGPFDLLLLKAESDDTVKENAIAEFLELADFRLMRTNVGENKSYADDYQFVRDNLLYRIEQIDPIYQSRFVTHFYSPQEIEGMKARWLSDTP